MVKYIRIGPSEPETAARRRSAPAAQSRIRRLALSEESAMLSLDYETLRLIWWALLGVLLIGFAVMDGFDLGVGHAASLRGADRRRAARG